MRICVPIQAKTQKEAKDILKKATRAGADLVEIWLDQIADLDLKDLLDKKPLPVVCVCKKPVEKGRFRGNYTQMADLLLEAADAGADYLDIPFAMPLPEYRAFRRKLNKKFVQKKGAPQKPKLIISHHDFYDTPSDAILLKKAKAIRGRGADVVKIATTAKSFADNVRLITLAKELQGEGIPHILIAMGKKGMLTRVLTPTLGGEMMFAPLDPKKASASGQITATQLKKYWSQLTPPL